MRSSIYWILHTKIARRYMLVRNLLAPHITTLLSRCTRCIVIYCRVPYPFSKAKKAKRQQCRQTWLRTNIRYLFVDPTRDHHAVKQQQGRSSVPAPSSSKVRSHSVVETTVHLLNNTTHPTYLSCPLLSLPTLLSHSSLGAIP